MDPLVSVNRVVKRYKRGKQLVEVLHNLDLQIPAGEFVALMGPSGSGKTTLLNLIGGLDRPTQGEVVVGGERIDKLWGGPLAKWRSRHVGFVFQFYNLMPTLSAEANVELPLLLTKLNGKQRKANVAAALELVGLSDRRKHKPNEFSGGQQQRVAIARAIVADPTLLVCDEPTGDLDRESAEQVLGLLQQLNREQGKTIIMVTHDPKAAEFASRIVHLDKGALVAEPAGGGGVKFGRLVWAGIWRKKGRAILTLLSIVNAFLIFGLLQGLSSGIDNVARESNAAVMMTFSKVSQIEPLPMGHAAQIRNVPGVRAVTPMVIFTSTYRTPTAYVPAIAVNVEEYLTVYPNVKLSPGARQAMLQTRNGALVGERLAKNYGWKVGDTVPLRAMFWTNRDSGGTWPVKIVGIMSGGPGMMVNYDYVDEGRTQAKGTTSFFLLKTSDPKAAPRIGAAVDRLFVNSPYETRSITPRQMVQSQIKQIGDIALVINAIVGAIFFALLFSVGAVMTQSMRERIPELAILKTLGFTDGGVMRLLLAETLVFCLFSAGIGLGIAALLFPVIKRSIGFEAAAGPILLTGFGFAVALAVICGLPPAIRAMRLQIVDALAGR